MYSELKNITKKIFNNTDNLDSLKFFILNNIEFIKLNMV